MTSFRLSFLILASFLLSLQLKAQGDCVESFGSIYGDPQAYERGNCLAATPAGDGVYVTGIRDDSLIILQMDLLGNIVWVRSIDVVPNEQDYPTGIIVDSEGMLGILGM